MVIKYSKKSLKFLSRLDNRAVTRIRTAVSGLCEVPPRGDIKNMQGCSVGRMRLRVGNWRVIYRVDGRALLVLDIGNRGDIYK